MRFEFIATRQRVGVSLKLTFGETLKTMFAQIPSKKENRAPEQNFMKIWGSVKKNGSWTEKMIEM